MLFNSRELLKVFNSYFKECHESHKFIIVSFVSNRTYINLLLNKNKKKNGIQKKKKK